MATHAGKGTAAADAGGRGTQRETCESDARAGALVGKPGLHEGQPSAGFGTHGFTTQEGGPERLRDGLGGEGGHDAPKFLGEPGAGVEAGQSRSGRLLYQRRDALDVEIHRRLSASGCGLDFDSVLDRRNPGDFPHLAHDGIARLPGACRAGEGGDAVGDLGLYAMERSQVVAGEPTHDQRRGLSVGVEAFGFVEELGGKGREQSEGEEKREQQAGDWEAGGRHDRVSPGKRPLGARGILRNPLNVRHSQMGMDGHGGTQHGR